MKTVEIWIRGRLLCTVSEDNECVQNFEQIVRKAGYGITYKEEDGKLIIIC
jgi:hypothetical protein